jgi:hypothetical protein
MIFLYFTNVKLLLKNKIYSNQIKNICREFLYHLLSSKIYDTHYVLASCKMRIEKYDKNMSHRYMNMKNCSLSWQKNHCADQSSEKLTLLFGAT